VVTAAGGQASGEIIYQDIEDITIEVGDMYDLDMDGDDVMDFHFRAGLIISSTSSSIWSFASAFGFYSGSIGGSSNQIIGYAGDFYYYGSALDAGVEVGPKASWLNFPSYSNSAVLASNFYGDTYGNFPGQGEKYLGVKFKVGENLHYGWIRLEADINDAHITIMDYAYENVPDGPIETGQMESVSVATIGSDLIQVYGYNAALYINYKDAGMLQLKIYDLQGNMVYAEEFAGGNHVIQSPVQAAGNYIVRIDTEKGVSTKEMFLN